MKLKDAKWFKATSIVDSPAKLYTHEEPMSRDYFGEFGKGNSKGCICNTDLKFDFCDISILNWPLTTSLKILTLDSMGAVKCVLWHTERWQLGFGLIWDDTVTRSLYFIA